MSTFPLNVLRDVIHQQAYCHHDAVTTSAVMVDVHFFRVGFTEAAADTEGFVAAFKAALDPGKGYYADLTEADFWGGPSYITAGAWIGDQTLALLLFGLIAFHGLGQVVTPGTLGITGEKAAALAGGGMVMCLLKKTALAQEPV